MSISVIQWTTGHVGREAVKGILRHPELELVGCYAWSGSKVGQDVGALCGLASVGITASGDIDALLAMDADCVCYMPTFPDIDEVERILASGKKCRFELFHQCQVLGKRRSVALTESGGDR